MRLRLLVLFAALCVASVAEADDAILILDASKSMWGRVQGKTKVEIARSVVSDLLVDIPPDRRLGLVAYGHRRANDCDDIEEVVPVGDDRRRIRDSVNALAFKGQTPLTAAVRFAAAKLHYTNSKATVILVSDGIESCKADPCAAGAELEKEGVDLTVHVVGFGITKKGEAKGLECLAEATGGRYFSANNAAELSRALQQTVAVKTAIPEPAVIEGNATIEGPASVPAGANFEIRWTGPNAEGDRVVVASPEFGPEGSLGQPLLPSREHGSAQMAAPSQPGRYELRYVLQQRKVAAREPLQVTPVAAAVKGPASVPVGTKFELSWTGPNYDGDFVNIVEADAGPVVWGERLNTYRSNGTGQLQAPSVPGKYELRYVLRGQELLARQAIELTAVTASVKGPRSVSAGSKFAVSWTGPNYDRDFVNIVEAEAGPVTWGENLYTYRGNGTGQLQAPSKPGKYELRYVLRGQELLARQAIEVVP